MPSRRAAATNTRYACKDGRSDPALPHELHKQRLHHGASAFGLCLGLHIRRHRCLSTQSQSTQMALERCMIHSLLVCSIFALHLSARSQHTRMIQHDYEEHRLTQPHGLHHHRRPPVRTSIVESTQMVHARSLASGGARPATTWKNTEQAHAPTARERRLTKHTN